MANLALTLIGKIPINLNYTASQSIVDSSVEQCGITHVITSRKVLDRFGPGGERATITLAGFVDEYSEMNEAAPVTIAKLRWLLVATQLTPPGGIIEYPGIHAQSSTLDA